MKIGKHNIHTTSRFIKQGLIHYQVFTSHITKLVPIKCSILQIHVKKYYAQWVTITKPIHIRGRGGAGGEEERLHLARTNLRINYNQKLPQNHLYNDTNTQTKERIFFSKTHLRIPLTYTKQMVKLHVEQPKHTSCNCIMFTSRIIIGPWVHMVLHCSVYILLKISHL